MMDEEEKTWMRGYRAALASMLSDVLGKVGYDDTEATRAKWIIEREQAIAILREVCEAFGDNDWDVRLNLSDIIDKHLARHLHARAIKK